MQKGPAVGFLILTEFLADIRLSDSRYLADWESCESKLRELRNALDEYLSLEELDHDVALELIIHRDRTCHVLDSWQKGFVNSVERAVLVNQERYVRERQRAAREGQIGQTKRR
jgi:hypothetical protein